MLSTAESLGVVHPVTVALLRRLDIALAEFQAALVGEVGVGVPLTHHLGPVLGFPLVDERVVGVGGCRSSTEALAQILDGVERTTLPVALGITDGQFLAALDALDRPLLVVVDGEDADVGLHGLLLLGGGVDFFFDSRNHFSVAGFRFGYSRAATTVAVSVERHIFLVHDLLLGGDLLGAGVHRDVDGVHIGVLLVVAAAAVHHGIEDSDGQTAYDVVLALTVVDFDTTLHFTSLLMDVCLMRDCTKTQLSG